jgi:hypothetical protein
VGSGKSDLGKNIPALAKTRQDRRVLVPRIPLPIPRFFYLFFKLSIIWSSSTSTPEGEVAGSHIRPSMTWSAYIWLPRDYSRSQRFPRCHSNRNSRQSRTKGRLTECADTKTDLV